MSVLSSVIYDRYVDLQYAKCNNVEWQYAKLIALFVKGKVIENSIYVLTFYYLIKPKLKYVMPAEGTSAR
jgi:hypothetical protein